MIFSTLLLAACAVSGFVVGKANVKEASAATTSDPDLDVGLNVQRTVTGEFQTCQFYVNSFESTDVSGGNYLAFRMK